MTRADAWILFAAATLTLSEMSEKDAADVADVMLAEFDERAKQGKLATFVESAKEQK